MSKPAPARLLTGIPSGYTDHFTKESPAFWNYPLSDLKMHEFMLALCHPNGKCEVLEAYK